MLYLRNKQPNSIETKQVRNHKQIRHAVHDETTHHQQTSTLTLETGLRSMAALVVQSEMVALHLNQKKTSCFQKITTKNWTLDSSPSLLGEYLNKTQSENSEENYKHKMKLNEQGTTTVLIHCIEWI